MRYLNIGVPGQGMGDAYGEGTTGHGLGHDRPRVCDRYVVGASLDTVVDELSARMEVAERGYPVAGVYGPTRTMETPVAVRCYDVGKDAAMRIAHDTEPDAGVYMSRVTLYADTADRVEELQDEVDAVMAGFDAGGSSILDRLRDVLPR